MPTKQHTCYLTDIAASSPHPKVVVSQHLTVIRTTIRKPNIFQLPQGLVEDLITSKSFMASNQRMATSQALTAAVKLMTSDRLDRRSTVKQEKPRVSLTQQNNHGSSSHVLNAVQVEVGKNMKNLKQFTVIVWPLNIKYDYHCHIVIIVCVHSGWVSHNDKHLRNLWAKLTQLPPNRVIELQRFWLFDP